MGVAARSRVEEVRELRRRLPDRFELPEGVRRLVDLLEEGYGVVAEELLRAVAGLRELVKRIRSDLEGLPEDVRRALRPFEEYYEAVTRELLRIAVEVPELAKHIDVPTTFLNFPRIVLSHRVVLSKRSYERLRELGYDIDIGCAAACGFGYLKRVDRGDSIEFIAVDCPCHPGAYFLVLYPLATTP